MEGPTNPLVGGQPKCGWSNKTYHDGANIIEVSGGHVKHSSDQGRGVVLVGSTTIGHNELSFLAWMSPWNDPGIGDCDVHGLARKSIMFRAKLDWRL